MTAALEPDIPEKSIQFLQRRGSVNSQVKEIIRIVYCRYMEIIGFFIGIASVGSQVL
jgi:hypothetical protein